MHTATTEAAARALFEAERTGEVHAIQHALDPREAYRRFKAHNDRAAAATQREATRLHAIGPEGREAERRALAHSPFHL